MKKLKISDTSYYNVMRGNPNILLEQFDCIFTPSANSKAADTSLINGFTDYTLFCTLCFHKFNLKTIEQDIKRQETVWTKFTMCVGTGNEQSKINGSCLE